MSQSVMKPEDVLESMRRAMGAVPALATSRRRNHDRFAPSGHDPSPFALRHWA
jgi:hypothetical protein